MTELSADDPVIDLGELRRCFELLIATLEGDSSPIRLEEDAFWSLAPDERYNVYDFPEKAHVSQLSESWERLQRIDVSNARPFALVWLADILRYLGEAASTRR